MSLCKMAEDYGSYSDRRVAIRAIYYSGLRESCARKCADAPWPSFVDVMGGTDRDWSVIKRAYDQAKREARRGPRVEVWVTAIGRFRTKGRLSPLGPCDRIGSHYWGYGHLGVAPAQLDLEEVRDVEVRPNPKSPYDYSRIYEGAADASQPLRCEPEVLPVISR